MAFWIGLEMNFNPSANHLQIAFDYQGQAPRKARQGIGSTLLKVDLLSRKV